MIPLDQGCIHQKSSHGVSVKKKKHETIKPFCSSFEICFLNLNFKASYLSAHEDVDEGVVGGAGLGKEWGDDGHCRGDHVLPAKGLHHGHNGVGRPTQQEAGDHQEKHHGYLLLVTQDLDDLNCLQVLDGAELQETRDGDFVLFTICLTCQRECFIQRCDTLNLPNRRKTRRLLDASSVCHIKIRSIGLRALIQAEPVGNSVMLHTDSLSL